MPIEASVAHPHSWDPWASDLQVSPHMCFYAATMLGVLRARTRVERVEDFVAETAARLDVAGTESVRMSVSTMLRKCGCQRLGASNRGRIAEALDAVGVSVTPLLSEIRAGSQQVRLTRPATFPVESGFSFRLESELATFLERHYRHIPMLARLRLLQREYPLDDGRRIDLLFEETGTRQLVVVELKTGPAKDGAARQLVDYVETIRHSKLGRDRTVRGVLITREAPAPFVDDLAALSVRHGVQLTWLRYAVRLSLHVVLDLEASAAGPPLEVEVS